MFVSDSQHSPVQCLYQSTQCSSVFVSDRLSHVVSVCAKEGDASTVRLQNSSRYCGPCAGGGRTFVVERDSGKPCVCGVGGGGGVEGLRLDLVIYRVLFC